MRRIVVVGALLAACSGGGGGTRGNAGASRDASGNGDVGSAGAGGDTATPPSPPGSPTVAPAVPSRPSPDADTVVFVDATKTVGPISPYIYGTNTNRELVNAGGGLTIGRVSGNRWSTYNWETNASNAGAHSGHVNDSELAPPGARPAAPVLDALESARTVGAPIIVTVPMLGQVAADSRGPVAQGEPGRFLPSLVRGGGSSAMADTNDGVVYQDAFVASLRASHPDRVGSTPRVVFCLDNEPELWAENHPRPHPQVPTYDEVIGKNIAYAEMLDDVWPDALVLGGVYYGWDAFESLQSAPDRASFDYPRTLFLEVYLDAFRAAERCASAWSRCDTTRPPRRLLDALDVHWYPEARGDGQRIIVGDATPGLVQARIQAPRSLWDPTYIEDSWITAKTGRGIAFLPWVQGIIANRYAGTSLVISEYNFGGGADISGAIATADALGLFGRYGVQAALLWELQGMGSHAFIYAAIAMYRGRDPTQRFGDTAVDVTSSDSVDHSVFASTDSARPGVVVVIAINKKQTASRVWLGLTSSAAVHTVQATALTAASETAVPTAAVPVTDNAYVAELAPMSVTRLTFTP